MQLALPGRRPPRDSNCGNCVSDWSRLVWGVDRDVLYQPFGRIDRGGPAVVFDIPASSATITARHAGWHLNIIRRLRHQRRTLAIFVRTIQSAYLRPLLEPDDVVVAELTAALPASGSFKSVLVLELPPLADAV